MIPYPELAAALDRWRVKMGKPTSTPIAVAPPSVAAVLPVTRPAPMAAPTPVAPPAPPRPAARPPAETIDDEVDADMLEAADEYDNDGQDFAMSFAGSGAAATASGSVGDDGDEATHIGAAAEPVAAPAPPSWPEAREWPAEATAAASYGWGQPARPDTEGADDETIVGGKSKR